MFVKEGWKNRESGRVGDPRIQYLSFQQLQDSLSNNVKRILIKLEAHLFEENHIKFFLFAPALWVSLENLRSSHSEYGFSWLGLGYSQFQNLPVIQLAEWTGVYGVSWLILLVNCGLYLSWKCWRQQKQKEFELKVKLNKEISP